MVFIWVYAQGWDIETVIQNEISQEEKKKFISMYICGIQKKNELICKAELETQM